jgi:hypothetical protein
MRFFKTCQHARVTANSGLVVCDPKKSRVAGISLISLNFFIIRPHWMFVLRTLFLLVLALHEASMMPAAKLVWSVHHRVATSCMTLL